MTTSRPSSAPSNEMQAALIASNLQQYSRRLTEMGFTRLGHLLKIPRGSKLDELLDHLKPLPGHRVRLLNFVEEERARAQANAANQATKNKQMPVTASQAGDGKQRVPRNIYGKPTSASRPRSATRPAVAPPAPAARSVAGSTATKPSTAEAAAEAAVAAAAAA